MKAGSEIRSKLNYDYYRHKLNCTGCNKSLGQLRNTLVYKTNKV